MQSVRSSVGGGEFGESVTHRKDERQTDKCGDHDAVGQQDAQFVEGKLAYVLAYVGQITGQEQECRHEEHEDDLAYAGIESAKVYDVYQYDHQYEHRSDEVDVVVCLSFHYFWLCFL